MSALPRALVWGASGHALVVANAARLSGTWEVVGFIDELKPARRGEPLGFCSVLGGRDCLPELRAEGVEHVLLGVGDNRARLRIAAEAEEMGFRLPPIVHPAASVAPDATIAEGAFVSAGAVVNSAARVGRAAIVNSNAVVEHHCDVAEGVHIAPGALLAGNVRVGRLSWVGIGAVVIEGLTVGDETQLGAGAVVVRNVGNRVVAYGVPALERRPLG